MAQRGFARYSFDPQVRQLGYVRYERTSPNPLWATVLAGPRWRADAGIRLSHFEISAPDAQFGSAGIAPTTATGSAGVMLTLTDGLRVFGSV
ncbi:MAG: hypothetical protein Q8S13_13250, partial [Dehalococcoidia bacterium]|nr:hypothetical protein [Dehalococcoidia bacterium]